MLRIMILISGSRLRIWDVASTPFSIGMAMSITTILGRSSAARRTASRPSEASPTTETSGDFSSSARRPWRTIPWSSAINTRKFMLLLRDRQQDRNACAPARLRFDVQSSSDLAYTLLHAEQPKAAPPRFPAVKPDSVILDNRPDIAGMPVNGHLDLLRIGMPTGICERLLHDPVDTRAHIVRYGIGVAGDGQLYGNIIAQREFLRLPAKRRRETQVIEHGGTKEHR